VVEPPSGSVGRIVFHFCFAVRTFQRDCVADKQTSNIRLRLGFLLWFRRLRQGACDSDGGCDERERSQCATDSFDLDHDGYASSTVGAVVI
jgi:hypothetical protein